MLQGQRGLWQDIRDGLETNVSYVTRGDDCDSPTDTTGSIAPAPLRFGCSMELSALRDLVTILALSIGILLVSHRLRLPPVVGLLLTGVIVGPYGLGLVHDIAVVESLAEVGVILLLFTIGIEFSLHALLSLKRIVGIAGSLQVGLSMAGTYAAARLLGRSGGEAALWGFLVALSSTAIALKLLGERGETDSPHGRIAVGVLILQDLSVVPMMFLLPLLAGNVSGSSASLGWIVVKAVATVTVVLVSARMVIPPLLYQVVRTRSHELFVLSIVVICFGTAWLTSLAGLSLALGAFVAGILISESDYGQQALADVLPLRDLFSSLFFVSVGMLLHGGFALQHAGTIGLIVIGVLLGKFVIGSVATLVLRYPLRTALLTGFALAQIGEFSFVLARAGMVHGLIGEEGYQVFVAAAVITMLAAPFLLRVAPVVADGAAHLPLARWLDGRPEPDGEVPGMPVKDHVVIAGFGLNGRNVARALEAANIAYVVLEMNPETVRTERGKGTPIIYGDAAQEAVLRHAHIEAARVVVVAISDAAATRRVVELARRLNPGAYVIARTRYSQEVGPLSALGANEAIPEEFETSIEIFARVLQRYLVPREDIERQIATIREDGYEMLRQLRPPAISFLEIQQHLADLEVETFRVEAEAPAAGKTLAELRLREQAGVTVLAIQRDGETLTNPWGGISLRAGDLVIALGKPTQFAAAAPFFRR
jgi:monovalent cation:H+ antiporter-2, CPA2 family